MITRPLSDTPRPRIHMHMLHRSTSPRDRVAYKHLVDLLRVLVVHVRVPLLARHRTRDSVDVGEQVGERVEDGAGLDEFVHVPGEDDARVDVRCKDGLDKVLMYIWRKFVIIGISHEIG